MVELRIGHGYDVHRLIEGRPLILGGVTIQHELGLLGHSDADVLTHAVMDALLGAAGLPDIGWHFPPTEEAYRDADSMELLRQVIRKLKDAGVSQIVNIDATIMAQQPRMAPHLDNMKQRLSNVIGIELSRVNIKATTTEKLGFVGRQEGIAAEAVCLIVIQHG